MCVHLNTDTLLNAQAITAALAIGEVTFSDGSTERGLSLNGELDALREDSVSALIEALRGDEEVQIRGLYDTYIVTSEGFGRMSWNWSEDEELIPAGGEILPLSADERSAFVQSLQAA